MAFIVIRKYHILIIASWYKKSQNDIEGPFVEEQARMLMRAGNKVSIFHPYLIDGFKERLFNNKRIETHINDDGLETWYYGEMSIVPYFRKLIYNHLCVQAEKVFLHYVSINGMPDILHAHSVFMGGVFANFLSKKYNIPYVITEHSSRLVTDIDFLNKTEKNLVQRILNDSGKSIYVSKFQLERMIEYYFLNTENSTVIHNVLNPIFKYNPFEIKTSPFLITVIGALTEIKNQMLLLKAIKRLKNEGIQCVLNVIGSGENIDNLEEYVRSNSLKNEVKFLGSSSRMDVLKVLMGSHFLISVSKFETFGVNIIEALGVGLPVISTPSGGPAEIITSRNGILLKSYEEEELVNAIILMTKNLKFYDSEEISKDCHAKYSEATILSKIEEVYRKVTGHSTA